MKVTTLATKENLENLKKILMNTETRTPLYYQTLQMYYDLCEEFEELNRE